MKILYVSHEKRLNGASKSLLNIIDKMKENGHMIYVLTPYRDGAFYNELLHRSYVNVIIKPYFFWCQAKTKIGWIKNKIMWPIFRSQVNRISAMIVSNYIKKEKIDIIHTNTSVINIGALISHYSRIPHIWHIREFGDLDFDMHYYEPVKKVYSFMNKNTDRFICISNAIANHYSLLDKNKIRIVYNGIEESSIININKKNDSEKIRILIAGAIYIGKGQHEAVEACEILLDRGIDNFELLIAGEGEVYFNISKKVENNIKFLGHVNKMRELRKNIDIELVCSRCEAFGRVTAEAMLAGIPVIGSNTGGTPELIENGTDGFLYDKGNAVALADKIEFLINNPSIRKEMGGKAQNKAIQHFLISTCVKEIEKVYYEVSTENEYE
ncbi:glycosyltransferase family 4 protein [Ruminococcus flavefaciens]|uniref:Glycosyltransferase involved in cell wall bisynthesis n=1 Tax=Ruminococcus flavefaciens TaxID=1265 RepID=A0A1M7G9T8_RUMFL|nr:glycosyltransferase family 4 protein [Ruminococcus flavefaciens]SHM13011.1 Glycosyltransferase involved in cell wall bisynthesis [Ruminococcus flavefaciens]